MSGVPSTAVADVLQLRGETGWLSPPLRPMTVCAPAMGTARTVRLAPGPGPSGLGPLRELLATDLAGRVVVIADAGHAAGAVWGEILSLAARGRGAVGVLVDGAVRDLLALDRIGLPVWARKRATAGPGPEVHVAEIGGPCTIGAVTLNDGDRIVMDTDGVVALCLSSSAEVLAAAAVYARAEEEVTAALEAGHDLGTAYAHKSAVVARLRLPPLSRGVSRTV